MEPERIVEVFKPAPRQIEIKASDLQGNANVRGQTMEQLAKCKGPDCYQTYIESNTERMERTELRKLMNFFARGKYE